MAMNRETFERLVAGLEARAEGGSLRLKLELLALAMLAHGVVFAWVVGFVLLAVVCAVTAFTARFDDWVPFALLHIATVMMLAMAWKGFRLLLIHSTAPEGMRVTPEAAPALFAMLDDVRRESGKARFHEVVLDAAFNARACYRPRFGWWGRARHSLVLGLPLLECLAVDEVRAVAAHEFAHLSGSHGRFSAWVYRQRHLWATFIEGMELRAGRFGRPLAAFIRWLWPRLNARAFVLSRMNELEADRASVRVAGLASTGAALWRINALGERLESELWPSLWRESTVSPLPPGDAILRVLRQLSTAAPAGDEARWKGRCIRALTGQTDTHPALRDRLAALGLSVDALFGAAFPLRATSPASEALLQPSLADIRTRIQADWERDNREMWQTRHGAGTNLQHRLDSLESATGGGPLSVNPDVLWEKAAVLLQRDGSEAAEPLLRHVLGLRPNHAGASLALGRLLVDRDDVEGEALLWRVLHEHKELLTPSGEALLQHYRVTGQDGRRREVQILLDQREKDIAEAEREESCIRPSDAFAVHGLPEDALAMLQKELIAAGVTAAWLARKEIKAMPSRLVYVLVVTTRKGWFDGASASRDQDVVARLVRASLLPGRALVVSPGGALAAVARRVRRHAGAALALDTRDAVP